LKKRPLMPTGKLSNTGEHCNGGSNAVSTRISAQMPLALDIATEPTENRVRASALNHLRQWLPAPRGLSQQASHGM
jgi:hypothetical protein